MFDYQRVERDLACVEIVFFEHETHEQPATIKLISLQLSYILFHIMLCPRVSIPLILVSCVLPIRNSLQCWCSLKNHDFHPWRGPVRHQHWGTQLDSEVGEHSSNFTMVYDTKVMVGNGIKKKTQKKTPFHRQSRTVIIAHYMFMIVRIHIMGVSKKRGVRTPK